MSTFGSLFSLRWLPGNEASTGWSNFTASIVGCGHLLPLLATASVVVSNVTPIHLFGTKSGVGYEVLNGTVLALVLWLVIVVIYAIFGFCTVRRANSEEYGQLTSRLDQLSTWLATLAPLHVSLAPKPPAPTLGVANTYDYTYTLTNDGNAALDQVALFLTVPTAAAAPTIPAPPAGWANTILAVPPNTIVYTTTNFGANASRDLTIQVPGAQNLSVDVSVTAYAASGYVSGRTTIQPTQTTAALPLTPLAAHPLREALAQRDHLAEELRPGNGGLRWVLATGYIAAWRRMHRAEEALLEIKPRETVIAEALSDEQRLIGSTIATSNQLLAQLRAAVQVLDPNAAATLLSQTSIGSSVAASAPSASQARAVLRYVRHTINDVRDDSWAGLVRLRNQLYATIFLSGLIVYALAAFILSQAQANAAASVTVVGVLFLVGAVVGLVNQLYQNSQANQAVEDYGMYLARLINTPVISGIAAVLGVVLTILVPSAVAPTPANSALIATSTVIASPVPTSLVTATSNITGTSLLQDPGAPSATVALSRSPKLPPAASMTGTQTATPTPTETQMPTDTPSPTATSTSQPAGVSSTGGPQVDDLFDLEKYPLEVIIAAVFGLTPNLLLSRLTNQATTYQTTISSTEPTNNS